MVTHPLWRPYALPTSDEVDAAFVVPRVRERVQVVPYDPGWPEAYARVRARVVQALGEAALAVEHVGSTAVPGLAAKPVVDVDVTVADATDEDAWLPPLQAAGLVLVVREPEWEQHRSLRGQDPRAIVHVWPPGAHEPRRHVLFRQWLRAHGDDRAAYGALKQRLAAQGFDDVATYNDAKAAFVYDVYERAFAADPAWPHDPRPRPG